MSFSVEVDNVTKRLGKSIVLDSVSFTVDKPGCYAVLGPNGAGKTTLFRVLTTLIYPDKGKVLINGEDAFKDKEKALRNLGALVSVPEPPDFMKVGEFIEFSAKLRGKEAKLNELNEKLDLPDLNRRCGKLSKGQKRRVFLAALVAQDPDIMVLDEPTDGLDPIEIFKVKGVIRELKRDKIILYSSHIMSEVVDMCDYVFIMNKGKIVYKSTITNLERMFRPTSLRVEFEYHVPIDELKATLNGLVKSIKEDGDRRYEVEFDGNSETRQKILKALVDNFQVRSFYDSTSSLESAFVKVLGVFNGGS